MTKLNLLKYRSCVSLVLKRHVSTTYNNSFKVQDGKDFDERVINSKKPVIVDFFATWCGPCKLLAPRIESIIDEQSGKILLAKVDIDELTDLAMDYDVNVVPTLVAFSTGKPQGRIVGVQDEDKLRTFVKKYIEQ